jgi:hypothetical protein
MSLVTSHGQEDFPPRPEKPKSIICAQASLWQGASSDHRDSAIQLTSGILAILVQAWLQVILD